LSITNGSSKNETLKPKVQFVTRQFSGDSGGRVALPSDYIDSLIASTNSTAKVSSGNTWSSEYVFDVPMKDGKVVVGNYVVRMVFGESPILSLYVVVQPTGGLPPPKSNDVTILK
jgi:hypothetical protein